MKNLLCFLTLIISLGTFSQNPTWINYSSGVWVNCVAMEEPFLWAGTNGGLVKINTTNGATTYYNRGNSDLPDNAIKSIAIDGYGNKWIATDAGVTFFDGELYMNYDTSSYFIPGNIINSIYATESETIYICTNKGYVKFNGMFWATADTSNSELPDNDVQIIRYDHNDNLWIGTKNGLAKQNINNWTVYNTSNSALNSNNVKALAIDQDNVVWAGTWMTGGLVSFDGNEWTDWGDIHYALTNQIPVIYVDSDNRKWMGTPHEGIMILDGEDLTLWEYGSGIPSVYIHDITQGASGIMYIASGFGGGLMKFHEETWSILETSNVGFVSHSNRIRCVSIAPDNDVYIGITNHGLSIFDLQDWTNCDAYINQIYAIHTTNDETTWMCTGDGIAKVIDCSFLYYNIDPIISITSETDNTIWYGGLDALFMKNENESNYYNPYNSDIQPGPYGAIAVDKNNTKWIGSYYGGLSSFDDENWQIYDMSNSDIPFETIRAIAVDTNNHVWIGGWGLARFDGNEWLYYTVGNSGLPDNNVSTITIDGENKLWIGTISGMAVFDGNNWETFSVSNSGIPYNTINQIDIDLLNNKWIATERGLGVYNEDGVILGIEQRKISLNQFKSWPNPANEFFYVQNPSQSTSDFEVFIYDMNGQLVRSLSNLNSTDKIPTTGLKNGLYLVEIYSDGKKGFAKVLVRKN